MFSLKKTLLFAVAPVFVHRVTGNYVPAHDFYELSADDTFGQKFSFENLRGVTAIVITNVASFCGRTDANYKDFLELTDDANPEKAYKHVHMMAFPCNQFGAQEPGTPAELHEFVSRKGLAIDQPGSRFHLMLKVDVNGQNTHPVFKLLKKYTNAIDIKWNFDTKFVIACQDVSNTCHISRHDDGVSVVEALKKAGLTPQKSEL